MHKRYRHCQTCRVEYPAADTVCPECGAPLTDGRLQTRQPDATPEMEVVCQAWGAIEAEEILALLKSCDIPATAPGIHSTMVNSVTMDGPATIHIYTLRRYVADARKILSEQVGEAEENG